MSCQCIELSSDDDDIQIIETQKPTIKKNSNGLKPLQVNSVRSALEKLTKNSAIEFIINIDDIPPEPLWKNASMDNSVQVVEKTVLQTAPNKKAEIERERSRSSSPEVVIIDEKRVTPPIKSNPSSKDVLRPRPFETPTEINPRITENKVQVSTSEEIVYIIDDNSDEEIEIVKKENQPNNKHEILKNINKENFSECRPSSTETLLSASSEKINNNACLKEISSKLFSKGSVVRNGDTLNNKNNSVIKKRVPLEVVNDSKDVPDNPARVTRSSLSNPFLPSTSKVTRQTTRSSQSSENEFSIESMFKKLVDVCNQVFTNEKLELKLWNTFKKASDQVLKSEEFISSLKTLLNTSEIVDIKTVEGKTLIQRDVNEVIRIMKRHPAVVDKKVRKLSRMLTVIRNRIKKLEEMEVTSDEDGEEENAYILLYRYRARAAKIYEKICELQNEHPDAGRFTKQKFRYTGNSGYPKIEQALQKFYLKTKQFPDFMDVKTLVQKTLEKENADIPPHKILTVAQTIFSEFGTRLQRMRCFDDYTIMSEYIEEGKPKDPALEDLALEKALNSINSSKRIREQEQKILQEFVCKQNELQTKENTKSEESDEGEENLSDDEGSENKNTIPVRVDLHLSDTEEELLTDKRQRETSSDEEEEENRTKKRCVTNEIEESNVIS